MSYAMLVFSLLCLRMPCEFAVSCVLTQSHVMRPLVHRPFCERFTSGITFPITYDANCNWQKQTICAHCPIITHRLLVWVLLIHNHYRGSRVVVLNIALMNCIRQIIYSNNNEYNRQVCATIINQIQMYRNKASAFLTKTTLLIEVTVNQYFRSPRTAFFKPFRCDWKAF